MTTEEHDRLELELRARLPERSTSVVQPSRFRRHEQVEIHSSLPDGSEPVIVELARVPQAAEDFAELAALVMSEAAKARP